jgi:SAM-dependent methyltransferase
MGEHHDHRHGHHDHDHGPAALAELLDLDADVLGSYLADVTGWVGECAGDGVRRVVDLGAGTGTGTIALAGVFGAAELVAVDRSAEMLSRIRAKALAAGLDGRVRLVQADLDAEWPAVGPADVVWASNWLHEVADPASVLGEVLAGLRPGGLLAVAELDGWPRFLPEVGPEAELESRWHAVLDRERRAGSAPDLGADWAPALAAAGFEIVARRRFVIELGPPSPPAAGRYAQAYLRHIRPLLDGRLGAGDLAALDALIDDDGPDGVLRRDDLAVRAARTAWIARRPERSPAAAS